MADSLRTDAARAIDHASQADRDAKIEQLLLAGLDHYFSERYEQAIDVWTRTLFFDRSHARARAYIDRARSALAERQRRSEELLQKGAAALDRGDGDEARRLLQAAVESGAHAHDVHPLLDRLSRQITSSPVAADDPLRTVARLPASLQEGIETSDSTRGATAPRNLSAWLMTLVLAAVLTAVYATAMQNGIDLRSVWGPRDAPVAATTAPAARETTLPVPRRGEMALGRARALAVSGRLYEALAALEVVRATDPEKPEADRVRADIQRQLVGLAGRQP
jgi:tetratricopeptide (TPR) repeat protein